MTFHRIAAAIAGLVLLAFGPAPARAAGYDGLKVSFCGTSGPLPVVGRAKPCTLIQAGSAIYLVDVGPESAEVIQMWRLPLADTRAVFITHLHSDHIGDLGEFNNNSWVAGRPQPLLVVGPAGVDALAAGFNQAYAPDHGFRNAHHEHDGVKLPIAAGLLEAKVVTLPAAPDAEGVRRQVVFEKDGLVVTAFAVAHDPATPAFGYRFDYKGRSAVFSGDTRKWEPLAKAAKGADLMVHEAQNNDMTRQMVGGLKMIGQARLGSIMGDTVSYHTTPVEAAELAKEAGVKALVLDHLTQAGLPFYKPETFTKGIEAAGFSNWRLAEDGMTVELPAGSSEVKFGHH